MTVIEFDKDQRKIVLSVREYFKERDKAEFEEFKEKYKPKPVKLGDAFGEILGISSAKKTEQKVETAYLVRILKNRSKLLKLTMTTSTIKMSASVIVICSLVKFYWVLSVKQCITFFIR